MKRFTIAVAILLLVVSASVAAFIHEPYAELSRMIAATKQSYPALLQNAIIAAEAPKDRTSATFTDQLIKCADRPPTRALSRHLQDLALRLVIDIRFSKEQVLSAYLDRVYLGPKVYGVDQASYAYFGKATEELSLAECSLLAGLIRSPNYYSPRRSSERALQRRSVVLQRMVERGFVSPQESIKASNEPLRIRG